ncbi:MAG: hypothetical protein HC883_02675 [Bdellovibrionaceae bacterium]|nr:hypothetical protein [Pseudobdellovibrionaceae bacterium]
MDNPLKFVIRTNINKIAMSLFLAAVLSGCHGQNPFKRESNPIKEYPRTAEMANQAYVPGQKPATPPISGQPGGSHADAEPEACFENFTVKAEPDHGNLLLKFVEGIESTYVLKVTGGGSKSNLIELDMDADAPEGAELRLMSREQNVVTYNLIWTPAKGPLLKIPAS